MEFNGQMQSSSIVTVESEAGGKLGPVGHGPTVEQYVQASKSDATLRAYASALKGFASWCRERGCCSLPAEPSTVAEYLRQRANAGKSMATLASCMAAITWVHKRAELPSPCAHPLVCDAVEGIRRRCGTPQRQAAAITVPMLRELVCTGDDLNSTRDRALLLLGFAAALRRSELVALDVSDVVECDDGLVVTVRRSKTDQQGNGRQIPVPFGSDRNTCPVRAFRAWLAASGITAGPLFVSVKYRRCTGTRLGGRDVARIVKRACVAACLPTANMSGHSLRSGLATAAAKAGKSMASIQATTGHKSVAMVSRYIRRGTLFEDCAASGVGL
jgi:site-specific recombinase XerD